MFRLLCGVRAVRNGAFFPGKARERFQIHPVRLFPQHRRTDYAIYGEQAIEHIKKSNTVRSTYYSLVANKVWGKKENYDLYINANDTEENIVKQIEDFIHSKE